MAAQKDNLLLLKDECKHGYNKKSPTINYVVLVSVCTRLN